MIQIRHGNVGTVLSAVRQGGFWRVRIAWPNARVHYFGKFTSEKDAIEWITAHAWLTKPVTEDTVSELPDAD